MNGTETQFMIGFQRPKRLACESPRTAGVPLARWSLRELQREVVTRGVVATISGTTVWRWLAADAIRP